MGALSFPPSSAPGSTNRWHCGTRVPNPREPNMARICKTTCRQLARACERGCSIPCP